MSFKCVRQNVAGRRIVKRVVREKVYLQAGEATIVLKFWREIGFKGRV